MFSSIYSFFSPIINWLLEIICFRRFYMFYKNILFTILRFFIENAIDDHLKFVSANVDYENIAK